MRYVSICLAAVLSATLSLARAQVPVTPNPDHASMLASADPALAANKKLVYDFYREVFEGGHMELVDKYLAETYVQHNPNIATGRQAFVEAFSRVGKRAETVEERVRAPVVAIAAERDLVWIAFAREFPDPKDAGQKYSTTWFDLFRIRDGRIVEHWDSALKR